MRHVIRAILLLAGLLCLCEARAGLKPAPTVIDFLQTPARFAGTPFPKGGFSAGGKMPPLLSIRYVGFLTRRIEPSTILKP